MSISTRVAIVGVGLSRFRTHRDDADLFGLMTEAAEGALGDAGMAMRDVDAVILSQAPDALHGIGHPEQDVVGALALSGKPVLRAHTGGATGTSAAQLGWWAVASGRFRRVLVVGAEKMGDALQPAQRALNEIWDPATEASLPLNTISMSALSAVRYMHRYGATESQYAAVAARMRDNGTRNASAHLRTSITAQQVLDSPQLCWPITLGMSCPQSSGGCAVVMAATDVARGLSAPRAWINGFAARSNTYWMGDKMGRGVDGINDHATADDLRLAAAEAYRMAGVHDPRGQVDVVEPYVPFATFEPPTLEALGLADPGTSLRLGEEGRWDHDGPLPVSPSGGVVCANPISVTALVRVAEAAQQVRGRAGDHQVDGVRCAVATGAGGSVQFFGVAVLGDDSTVGGDA